MSISISVQRYLDSEEAKIVCKELELMVESPDYNTETSYSPTSDERVSFVDKHTKYLSTHQTLDYRHYISNLKLMTRIR